MKNSEKIKYSPALIDSLSVQANDLKVSTRTLRHIVWVSLLATILSIVVIIFTRGTDRLGNFRVAVIVILIMSLVSLFYSLPAYFVKHHMLEEIMKAKRSVNQ